jgi:IclR family acetate operon transcriptional repressor
MPRLTDRTITSRSRYLAALDEVRSTGYAVDDGENEVGGRCIAAALRGAGISSAISVSGPSARIEEDVVPDIGAMLRRAATEMDEGLEADLGRRKPRSLDRRSS